MTIRPTYYNLWLYRLALAIFYIVAIHCIVALHDVDFSTILLCCRNYVVSITKDTMTWFRGEVKKWKDLTFSEKQFLKNFVFAFFNFILISKKIMLCKIKIGLAKLIIHLINKLSRSFGLLFSIGGFLYFATLGFWL